MSKIRTLKAEFFRSEDTGGSLLIKGLAAGLICALADDEGRFRGSPGHIRAEVFPHEEVTIDAIRGALRALEGRGFLRLYAVDGREYGEILNWKRHQRIPPVRFQGSILPPAPEQTSRRHRASTTQTNGKHPPAERLSDASSRAEYGEERRGIGEEGKGTPPQPPLGDPEGQETIDEETTVKAQAIAEWFTSMTGPLHLSGRTRAHEAAVALGQARLPMELTDMLALMQRMYVEAADDNKPHSLNYFSTALEVAANEALKVQPAGTRGFGFQKAF